MNVRILCWRSVKSVVMKYFLILIPAFLLLVFCQSSTEESDHLPVAIADTTDIIETPQAVNEVTYIDTFFDRSTIRKALEEKIARNQPLIVHAYIPLCDNENQGIVPTSASLGDGMNLKSNLYWATSGGTKAYFKKQSDWKLVYDAFDIDTNVLERVVFERNYKNATVYLIADAYRGDRMEETVNDYLSAISSSHFQAITLNNGDTIIAAGNADMVMFNGHNGLMDNIDVKIWRNKDGKLKDVVMNSCLSYGYLQYDFMNAGGYPLVRTNTLLYPGAYVLEQIIDDWVAGTEEVQLCLNAGRKYCEHHDCGRGTKVYKTGW